jgi:excinuclease ABC subunit A
MPGRKRRYVETFSAYARQFPWRPRASDVDKIDGLSPVIAIEQRQPAKSAVHCRTITEIYGFLRLCFMHVRQMPMVYNTGENGQLLWWTNQTNRWRFYRKTNRILAQVIRARKGRTEVFQQMLSKFLKVRCEWRCHDITPEVSGPLPRNPLSRLLWIVWS